MIEIVPNWHPVFVHFTVAPLVLAALFSVLELFMRDGDARAQIRVFARWSLWVGTAFAVATALAGWYAYNSVDHDAPSHAAMTLHRNWALATLPAFMALAAWSIRDARRELSPGAPFIGLLFAAGLLLVSTAWHGGELVYRYGLGVMSLPQGEGEGEDRAHEHAEGGMHAPDTAAPAGEAAQADKPAAERTAEAPGPAAAKTAASDQPARKSRKPHNSDGHTHEHK